MKKILFIIITYSCGGGAESLLTTIVNHLDSKKYDISIIEIFGSDKKKEPVNKNIKILPYMIKVDHPKRKEIMYSFYHEWDKVISKYIPLEYDLYVAFNYQRPSFLLPPGKKNIAWIHSSVEQLLGCKERFEERELQREAFRKVNKIVAISDLTAESLMKLFPESKNKIVKLYNGLDIERVRDNSSEKTDIVLQRPALIMSGRLETRKQPMRAVEIFRKVHELRPEVHLYYMGYGPLEKEVMEYARNNNIGEYVHLLGYQQNPFPIVKQCDVSCLFSDYEGFPMSLLESVALGKPFVSTNIGGTKELSNGNKCGKIIETDEQAVNAIIYFLDAPEDEISNYCKESIVRFELGGYIKRVEMLFDEVLNEE